MSKRIHTKTKIFFKPYMVRLEYPSDSQTVNADFAKLMRQTYRLATATWGHSQIETESHQIKNDHNHAGPPGPTFYNGMNHNQVISSLFDSDWALFNRAYVAFSDEEDALMFKLKINTNAIRVHMWPERLFTIHEYIEDDGINT